MQDTRAAHRSATDPLLKLVHSALAASPYVESDGMRVEADAGAVRLHGEVGTFFEKQMAQETILRLDGVDRLENLLQVSWR
ncbi:MAG: BON domain-containing protein [Planctomycetota bacterium]